jgi:hypothetical protein
LPAASLNGLRRELEARAVPTFGGIESVASDSIDLVYSFNVLEHVEDDAENPIPSPSGRKRGRGNTIPHLRFPIHGLSPFTAGRGLVPT